MRNKKADFNTFGGEKLEFQSPDYGVTAPDIRFRETTFRGYSDPLQTLNVELLLIAPYGVERSSNMRRS
jgi:hypothetical protein